MMDIRKIEKEDIDKCVDLCIESCNRPPWNHKWSYDTALKYLREFADQTRFVGFILYEHDKITGILLGHLKTWWANDLLHIDEIFISPDRQKMGHGKLLLEHMEQFARDQGCGVVSLMTSQHMLATEFKNDIKYHHAEHYIFLFKTV
ncbi:GNAT family N-acetyltransferase [Mucilaginibacter sp. ZT4R22]|uniref:GNAT family N-acetyltransferase n=1 Tax=Mucilaginibacter pankratovii TaxID=2772110 RepID=A0ABR7WZ46_9SPHI|nr:GNAT family N-acetyltransferase [Mucilaginibacter pankratovii]MBD1366527.1 GNAT family N-acetyltransferase [Mucilaginibacter pankratovii]